jgi:multidrug efflux pump subunit AcrA (membrane-fusion protein)
MKKLMIQNKSSFWGFGVIALGICFLFSLGLAGCGLFPKEEEENIPALVEPPQEDYVTYQVTEGPISEELKGLARVGSNREQTLIFLISGQVREILVDYNGTAKKNQPLVSLETGELEYTIKQAKVNLEQEEIRFQQQFGGDSEVQYNLQLAELNLNRAQLDLDQAEERLKMEGSLSTGLQKKALQREVDRAGFNLKQNKLAYERLKSQAAPNSAAQRIAALGIERLRIEYERLQKQMEHSILRAPFDGKIISLKVARGDKIQAFDPVETIAAMTNLEFIMEVDFNKSLRLKTGMEARIQLDAGKSQTGRVILIDKRENAPAGKDIYYVHIRLDDPRFALKMDTYYDLTIYIRSLKKALVVSNDAIQEDSNSQRYLRVIEGDKQRDVYIKTGISNDTQTQILEGAAKGMVAVGK